MIPIRTRRPLRVSLRSCLSIVVGRGYLWTIVSTAQFQMQSYTYVPRGRGPLDVDVFSSLHVVVLHSWADTEGMR